MLIMLLKKLKITIFRKRIKELKNENIITDVYQYGNRPVVVVNIEGIKLPFYQVLLEQAVKQKVNGFRFWIWET